MTDDADLARLAAYTELAAAKLVLTGDHRQLGPVGPGGALGALVKRHPDAVDHLQENRRQHDPGERQALEALRDGMWARRCRGTSAPPRHKVPTRDGALQAVVEAWAAHVAAGHEKGCTPAAGQCGRAELPGPDLEASGRLTGPELASPQPATYKSGDRVVVVTPNADRSLVTSERATVKTVDLADGSLVLRTDDGRQVRLSAEHLGPDRLGYGYATPAANHRSRPHRRNTNTSPESAPRTGNRPQRQPLDVGGRQILSGYAPRHRRHPSAGRLDLLGTAVAADLRQGQVADYVAGGFDPDQLDGPRRAAVAAFGHVFGLPEGRGLPRCRCEGGNHRGMRQVSAGVGGSSLPSPPALRAGLHPAAFISIALGTVQGRPAPA